MQLLGHIWKPKSECHYKSLDPRSGTRSYARRELATLSAYGTNACIPTDLNASSRRRAVVKRSRASTRRRLQTQWQETTLSAVSSDAANSRGSQHDEGFTRTFTNVPRYHTLQAWPNNTTLRAPLNSCKMTDPLKISSVLSHKFCSQPAAGHSLLKYSFTLFVLHSKIGLGCSLTSQGLNLNSIPKKFNIFYFSWPLFSLDLLRFPWNS